jgi:hypothetical protein
MRMEECFKIENTTYRQESKTEKEDPLLTVFSKHLFFFSSGGRF